MHCEGCVTPYDLQQIAVKAPLHVFEALMSLKTQVQTAKQVAHEVQETRKQIKAEYDLILAIKDSDERNANLLRMNIVENVLTFHCPRPNCQRAFHDFDGCFALTCSNNSCLAGICAWCLADCGKL